MTTERLHDVLANIRYRLRHEAISDGFVEWLESTLELLRSRYRRGREDFQSEDILFLKHLADVTPKLSQYLAIECQVAVVKRGPLLIQELTNLSQQIDQTHDASLSLVTKQCLSLQRELLDLFRLPNPAVERDAPQAAPPSP
jgi:hypothetical protein